MNQGPSFQVLESERQTNPPPEGVEDATVTCWFCSHKPPPTRPDCTECKLCFLPTKRRKDNRPIAWYIGYLTSLQTPDERKIVLEELAEEFGGGCTRNMAVCFELQISGLSIVLRQLDTERMFSIYGADNTESGERKINEWSQLKHLNKDVRKELELLVVSADRKCKFQSQ
jgi:hypothetical protein